MAYPVSVNKNDYFNNRKDSTVYTPKEIADQLFDIIYPALQPSSVYDIGIGAGALSQPYRDRGVVVYGIDIECTPAITHVENFLTTEYFPKVDLVISNPPFNHKESGLGRKLLPEVWLRRIFNAYGMQIPVMMIVPMGFRLNQRRKSARYQWLRDTNITSIVALPIDAFNGVAFHAEIIIWNVPNIRAHYFLSL